MLKHSLVQSLFSLKGNPRACVYTEPLFGIPYFLYIPYASIYMVSLGLSDQQIGLLASIGMGFQIFTALLSGAITDKFGRRLTTFFSDLVSWTVPAFILIFAQNFWFFLAAAIFNSFWRISHISWSCLMVEDAEPDQIVPIWTWIYISGLLPAFFAPLSGRFIEQFDLIPAVRGLYLFAFVFLTLKFIVLLVYSTETHRGKERIRETHGQSIFTLMKESTGVANQIIRTPATLLTLGLLIVIAICGNINGTFWAILVTQKLGIPVQQISIFPMVRALIMLVMFFTVTPHINKLHFQKPMLVGFVGLIVSQVILILMPSQRFDLLILNALLEAGSLALVNPLVDSLVFFNVDPQERARMVAILYVVVFIFTSPFGWIAGFLSSQNKIYPFLLTLVLYSIGFVIMWLTHRLSVKVKNALSNG
jgi:DHA1 family tetracycline resistance protein-like MFS transporter